MGDDLLALLAAHATEERLGLPLLRMAQLLIEAKRLDPLLLAPATPAAEGGASGGAAEPFGVQLLERVRGVTRGSKDVPTLIVGLSLQVLLLPYATGPLLSDLLRSSVLLLAHKYPKVRKAAADQLYLHLLTFGDPGPLCAPPAAVPPPSAVAEACGLVEVAPEPESAAEPAPEPEPAPVDPGRLDVLMSLLLETPWLGNVEQHARPARATMLDQLGLPPPLVAAAAPQTKVKKSDEGTYAELVGEMGY